MKVYSNKMNSTLTTVFGNEKPVTMEYTQNRAYGALYLRIALSAVQIVAFAIMGLLVFQYFSPKTVSACQVIFDTWVYTWVSAQVFKSNFKIHLGGVTTPFWIAMVASCVVGLLPIWGLGRIVFLVADVGLMLVISGDELRWDSHLLDSLEQFEMRSAEKDEE